MPSYKKYYSKNLGIKFFPKQNLIILKLKKGGNLSDLRQEKEKLETYLSIKSSNLNKSSDGLIGFALELDKNSTPNSVDEYLKQVFHGGDEVLDASDISEEEEEENQPPAPEQPPPQEPPQMESFNVDFVDILFESTYRTGEYWEILARASGRPKQSIDDKTILGLRSSFTKKPKGKRRDEVLRSLDSGMKYFSRKIRKTQGEGAAQQYREKYRSIGDLVPSDYSERSSQDHLTDPMDGTSFDSIDKNTNKERNVKINPGHQFDFSDFFDDQEEKDEEDVYEKFETQE